MLKRLGNLTGFKRYAAAFATGALAVLAMPPAGASPVLLACVPAFIVLARHAPSPFKSFLTGWAFGAGYFIFGLYWISAALFVDIAQWGWVLPLSLVVAPTIFALWYGLIPLLARRYRDDAVPHALAMVAAWALVEWLRGHLFTGFPWNLTGYAWMHVLPVMQSSAFVGIYGLTLLTLLWAAIPAFRENRALMTAVTTSFTVVALLGLVRMEKNPPQETRHTVRIVQANIPQTLKWNPDEDWRNLERHADLSASKKPFTFVVWPETAVTADLKTFPEIARYIAMRLPQGSHGILGALRVTQEDGKEQFYNSVSVLDTKAKLKATYDKHHLVPFGEYIPFRDKINLTPLALAVSGLGDFTRGRGPDTLSVGGLPPFSPLVCYEVIFPHEVAPSDARPEWLVNVTNDAWYGHSAGPYQHFEISRVRAIEEGLPLARAANTGISAMIDPVGRIVAKQDLGERGVVDSALPAALPPTFYAKAGDILFLLLLAGTWLLARFMHSRHARFVKNF